MHADRGQDKGLEDSYGLRGSTAMRLVLMEFSICRAVFGTSPLGDPIRAGRSLGHWSRIISSSKLHAGHSPRFSVSWEGKCQCALPRWGQCLTVLELRPVAFAFQAE